MLGALKWCDYTYDTVEILNTKTVEHQPYILYLLTFIYQQIHLVVIDAIRGFVIHIYIILKIEKCNKNKIE